jgi:hypothetical protein
LAEKLHMTVTQLCANTSSYEITQWIAYFKIKSEAQERERKRNEASAKSGTGGTGGSPQKFSIFDIPEQ